MDRSTFLDLLGFLRTSDGNCNAKVLFDLGIRYLREGFFEKAVVTFKKINLDSRYIDQDSKGFAKSIILANKGDAKAQYNLGYCYENGKIIKRNLEKAIQWYEKAAEQGFVEAIYRLGVIYFSNSYNYNDDCVAEIDINKKKINWHYYGRAGQEIDVKGNREKAFKLFERAAKQGHAEAQYRVGMCYAEGKGVEEDWGKALECFKKIEDQIDALNIDRNRKTFVENVIYAEKGYPVAQYHVGKCYAEGKGIKKNLRKAFEWYKKAAKLELLEAQYQVGTCYLEGKGVKSNWEKAIEFFTHIQDNLDQIIVSEDCKKIVKYAIFAEKSDAKAQYFLGYCYAHGKGIRKDWNKAIKWIAKSAEQNYPQAQYFLGLCYKKGKGVEMNNENAFEYFKHAAKQGLAQAQYELGICYLRGDGVVVNSAMAKEWLEKAAVQHYEEANLELQNIKPFVEPTYAGGLYSDDCSYNFEDNR